MKKILVFALGVFFCIQAAGAQSKVAVLDASLGVDVHPNAASIVADTINEQFVKSPDFIAIDRAYISSIQAEKQFQLSGEVADQDIKELGATFGADYLCIANVSLLGSTYTVSARLIEVSSAQVVAQESHRMQGNIDVLFTIAEVVGAKFVGASVPESQTAQVEETPQQPVVTPPPAPAPAPKPEKWKPKKRTMVGIMFPGYMGADGNDTYYGDNYVTFYEIDESMEDLMYELNIDGSASESSWGAEFHSLVPLGLLYISFGARYTSYSFEYEYYDEDYYEDVYMSYEIFNTIDLTGGLGAVFAPIRNMQIYGGVTAGYMAFMLGSNYDGEATDSYWGENAGELAGGFALGFEAGADFFLGNLCLSLKYTLSKSSDLTGEYIYAFSDEYEDEEGGDTSFGVHGLTLGVGFGN